jgi:hypothetical protein
MVVQVKPGGETNVEQNGHVTHESMDANIDGVAQRRAIIEHMSRVDQRAERAR